MQANPNFLAMVTDSETQATVALDFSDEDVRLANSITISSQQMIKLAHKGENTR
jgi:hypothetical protein